MQEALNQLIRKVLNEDQLWKSNKSSSCTVLKVISTCPFGVKSKEEKTGRSQNIPEVGIIKDHVPSVQDGNHPSDQVGNQPSVSEVGNHPSSQSRQSPKY